MFMDQGRKAVCVHEEDGSREFQGKRGRQSVANEGCHLSTLVSNGVNFMSAPLVPARVG